MTSKRFIHKARQGKYSSEKARIMNRARWAKDRARREAEMPAIERELALIEAENLPHRKGDPLGCLQWKDYRTGKVRKWIVRIGDRADQITVESPNSPRSKSHGWTWFFTQLRSKLTR